MCVLVRSSDFRFLSVLTNTETVVNAAAHFLHTLDSPGLEQPVAATWLLKSFQQP